MGSRKFVVSLAFVLLILFAVACSSAKPAVVIASPPSGSQYHEGDEVAVQSTSGDSTGVTRVELTVDGAIVRNDTPPSTQPNFSMIQTWKATQGSHTIAVRAYNAAGVASDPVAILVSVSAAAAPPVAPQSAPAATSTATVALPPPSISPTPSPSTSAPVACTNNAAFVADVSIPDGTVIAAGQTFVKTWRLSNNGTCAWGAGYQFVFISGEAMTGGTVVAVPVKNPGETADISVAMNAPAAAGNHTGTWRMRSPSNAVFGQSVTVRISVPGAPPAQPPAQPPATGCTGTPNIESFTASATTINGGQSTTLNWGNVTGAESVEIDNGIGGVPAPGSATVSPGSKTTYTMTARCGSNTKTAQVTINVQVLAPPVQAFPDLYVSEFSLDPSPPHKSQVTHVRIGVYNQGNAASGPFKVEWWAGSNYATGAAKTWTIDSMSAHGGRILTYDAPANTWGSSYGSITTRVKVDVDGSVTESNEGNNIFDKNISVSP